MPLAYDKISEKLVNLMEENKSVPWRKAWNSSNSPMNYRTKRSYHGGNYVFLWLLSEMKGYQYSYWMTFKQAQEAGGYVKKGAKGYPVYFVNNLLREKTEKMKDENGEEREVSVLNGNDRFYVKGYTVFNIEDIDGIEMPVQKENPVILSADEIIKKYSEMPILKTDDPAFNPKEDILFMPDMKEFHNSEEYYAAFFHEMIHSTAIEKRLNRKMDGKNGTEKYSAEELVAEIGSAMLSAYCGIETHFENSAAYLNNWIQFIKDDPQIFPKACIKAQEAVEYILEKSGLSMTAESEEKPEELAS
ncbi:MAG: DUF1738 domain-containing protein [Brevinematales bacterium]|nr:DUF1738 domain-containing protein [Brevinematales bacterium]